MLFGKTVQPRCAYCRRCAPLNEASVLCKKKGVTPANGHCRAFRYDPFKRIPPKPVSPDFSNLRDEDFTL